MKKIIYSVVSLFVLWGNFSMPATASQSQPSTQTLTHSLFNQGRIGFGLTGEYVNIEANIKIEPPLTLGNIQSSQSQIGKKLQVAPCIELGATIANDYYLGLLVSWRYSGAQNTSRSPIRGAYYFLHELRVNQYTDILIKPGYKFTPRTMIYGLIGPSIANWSHTTNQFNGNQTLVNKFRISKTGVGLGLGVGFEYLFQEKHAFSIDYTYHFQRSVSKSQYISYLEQYVGPDGLPITRTRFGNLLKKVEPSYGVIAVRFATFFQL